MSHFLVLVSGILFAIGLGISGMTDANKVIGFLNPLGGWDPSLAFVMVGAIGAHLSTRHFIVKADKPLFAHRFEAPSLRTINTPLVVGSGLFGVGWALGGFCPGPGLVSSVGVGTEALIFTGTMLSGMALFHVVGPTRRPQKPVPS